MLSAAPRATLLLEEEPIGCATLCEELLELVAEELLAVVAELLEEEPLLT